MSHHCRCYLHVYRPLTLTLRRMLAVLGLGALALLASVCRHSAAVSLPHLHTGIDIYYVYVEPLPALNSIVCKMKFSMETGRIYGNR